MKKVVTISLIIILFLAVGIGFYILGTKNRNTVSNKIPTPNFVEVTPSSSPAQEVLASPPAPQTQTVRGGGILTFPKYELTAGLDWVVTRESENPGMEQVTLTKEGYELSILEGGFGGAACLYPGDPDVEGPSARYTSYVEITAKSGDLFRRGTTTSGAYGICQKTQYGWEAPTLFGAISFKTPTPASPEIILEMDKIIASITRI
jgi:hypothetical protein